MGELLALKWSKVDLEHRTIVINDFTYKWLMEQSSVTSTFRDFCNYSGSP